MLQEITFGSIVSNIFSDIIISFVVVYVAQKIRDCFEYDTIVWYIVIVSGVYVLISAIMIKTIALF